MTLLPFLPWWSIFLLLSLGLASVIVQFWLLWKRVGRSRALIISLFRGVALFLLISFFLDPSSVARREHKLSPAVAVLIDTSQSMGLSRGKGTRLDEARAILNGGSDLLLKSLAESFEVSIYAVGESLKAVEPRELGSLKAGPKRGDLNQALERLNQKNTIVVLLSDGHVKWEGIRSTTPPLIIVPLGDPKSYKDLLIKTVKAPALAFRGREVKIDVTIKSYGYEGLMVPVVLKEQGRILTTRNVRLKEGSSDVEVSLSFTPEEVRQHQLSVSIPSQVGESLAPNNSVNLSLKVVRDKIRVLMVSGNPSMNYRFMRMAFKNDPSVDLLSFIILRTPTDIMNAPLQEQSLIPFPVETLFTKELKNFDLLIFDNFPYGLYLNPAYLETIRVFVKEGGGFAFIGGPKAFDITGYGSTPMAEILPVKLAGGEAYRRDSPIGVKITRIGTAHPITRDDEGNPSGLWQEMPSLDGFNVLEAKDSGSVLLESGSAPVRPLLTVGSYHKGRVLVLATDDSWKWYMGMVARGKGGWAYLRLMQRMVRWLTKEPSVEPVQIILPEKTAEVGQETAVRIRLREGEAMPPSKNRVSVSVSDPEGVKIASQLKETGFPGEYLASFIPEKGGTYRVRVESLSGLQEESVLVPDPLNDLDAIPDHERLKRIAASTGGKILYRRGDLLKEIRSSVEKSENRFLEERRLPVWNTPYVLILIIGLLSIEWYLRRRWGLV
jgi:uncharacterized membrane protein